ncbi:hypothetical protein ACFYPZ_38280 [Streptomyces sp. NPDC005506]|uniref:hypothetical protein n=1 Tax=unclassified Streptomyces TaxID=2593676 RepID=UPI0036A42EBB
MVLVDVKKVGRIPDGCSWRAHSRDFDQARAAARTKAKERRTRLLALGDRRRSLLGARRKRRIDELSTVQPQLREQLSHGAPTDNDPDAVEFERNPGRGAPVLMPHPFNHPDHIGRCARRLPVWRRGAGQ